MKEIKYHGFSFPINVNISYPLKNSAIFKGKKKRTSFNILTIHMERN